MNYFTSLSILVFAVGGCEKISPYVNKVKDPSKGFPKGMIMLAVMVMVCAILGSIAMGMMFDPAVINESTDSFKSYVSNGAYWSFQKLGEYYHVGNLLLVIYAACNAIGQFSTLVLSIDAPLRILLDNEDARQFVPSGLLKKNEHGAYINGIKMVICLSGSIILIQSFVPGAASVLTQLNKLNSVTMPLRYLWVFAAYIALRKSLNKFNPEYKFTKNQTVALVAGGWCFFVTAACCLLGMYVEGDIASTALNVITPVVLTALGLILPEIKKREDCKGELIYLDNKKTLESSDQKYQNSRVFFISFRFTLPRSDAAPTLSHSPAPQRLRSMGRRVLPSQSIGAPHSGQLTLMAVSPSRYLCDILDIDQLHIETMLFLSPAPHFSFYPASSMYADTPLRTGSGSGIFPDLCRIWRSPSDGHGSRQILPGFPSLPSPRSSAAPDPLRTQTPFQGKRDSWCSSASR